MNVDLPSPENWKDALNHMVTVIPLAQWTVIRIVTQVAYVKNPLDLGDEEWGPSTDRELPFLNPTSIDSYPHVIFAPNPGYQGLDDVWTHFDHDIYMDFFEDLAMDGDSTNNIDVYLQVESSGASVEDLIKIVYAKYGDFSCVKGFGVDVEFHNYHLVNNYGTTTFDNDDYWYNDPVSNSMAASWYNEIKAKNPNHKLFIKHWEVSKMPPTFRGNLNDIIFVDDSQDLGDLVSFVTTMMDFADAFDPNPVWYQIGCPSNWFYKSYGSDYDVDYGNNP